MAAEADDGAEHTTFEPPLGELGKETLDRVEPRGGRWCEMECPAWMPHQPGPDLGMLVRCIVVGDGVDQFARRDTGLDGVEEPNELLMPVTLHAAPDHPAVQYIEGGEQGRGAVALVVMRHRAAATLLHGQAWLSAVQRLDLALFIDRQHDGVGRRIDPRLRRGRL